MAASEAHDMKYKWHDLQTNEGQSFLYENDYKTLLLCHSKANQDDYFVSELGDFKEHYFDEGATEFWFFPVPPQDAVLWSE